uniref:Carboxypeptidase n=1 Tax=Anopheles farauti TaxID=69004 RepID=A0A182QFW1_9DIPT
MCTECWTLCIVLSGLVFLSVVANNRLGAGRQDWGYTEVRPKAFIFWWLYHAQSPPAPSQQYDGKPLIIWLQGGPGASSSGYGNFEEIGPLDRMLKPRQSSWVKHCNVLFIDSPVGSGFSYVEDRSLLARNSTTVVSDLLVLLKDFYRTIGASTQTDWEASVPLYIASESYGGRIAVELAYALAQEIQAGTMHCNLVGLLLGSAWLSPMDSIAAWPNYLHGLGYLDDAGRKRIERRVTVMALKTPTEVIDDWHALQHAVLRETEGINCYNVLKPTRVDPSHTDLGSDEVLQYGETIWWNTDIGPPSRAEPPNMEELMRGHVAHALGIAHKPAWGAQRTAVFDALSDDFLQSSTRTVERLLNETTIELVVYNGQLDLITCLPGTLAWMDRLFRKQGELNERKKTVLARGIGADIEGYRIEYSKRVTLYTILRAGHMVPADNPSAMALILQKHIGGL